MFLWSPRAALCPCTAVLTLRLRGIQLPAHTRICLCWYGYCWPKLPDQTSPCFQPNLFDNRLPIRHSTNDPRSVLGWDLWKVMLLLSDLNVRAESARCASTNPISDSRETKSSHWTVPRSWLPLGNMRWITFSVRDGIARSRLLFLLVSHGLSFFETWLWLTVVPREVFTSMDAYISECFYCRVFVLCLLVIVAV